MVTVLERSVASRSRPARPARVPVTPFLHEVVRRIAIVSGGALCHALGMFVVTEADAAAIRTIFNEEGELSAAIELRRRFPGLTPTTRKAWDCAKAIAGWMPPPAQAAAVTRLDTCKNG